MLDESLEKKLLSMLSHVGHMRDSRASSDMMSEEMWKRLPPESEIEELKRQRKELKTNKYRIKGTAHEQNVRLLTTQIDARKIQRRKFIKKMYRQYYFYHRPT